MERDGSFLSGSPKKEQKNWLPFVEIFEQLNSKTMSQWVGLGFHEIPRLIFYLYVLYWQRMYVKKGINACICGSKGKIKS